MLLLLFMLLFTRYRTETTLELTESITATCMEKLNDCQLKFSTSSTTGSRLWISFLLDNTMQNTVVVRKVDHSSFATGLLYLLFYPFLLGWYE
jgi:hypothetical protein